MGLLVKLAHKGVDEFAAKYATNLSDGGMFIRTREPKPRGTELSFKVELADGQRVLQGTAVVRWTRADADPNGPPGMGLEFLSLDPASRALVDRMLGKNASAPPVMVGASAVMPRPVVPPVIPPPPLIPSEVEGPLEDPDVFSALASSSHPENEVDVPLDSLVAQTPEPPPADIFQESGPSLAIDIEVEPPMSQPSPAPVLLEAKPEAPAPPKPATGGPVFLKNITPSDGTGPVIGIDLGTTNSACAVLTKGRPQNPVLEGRVQHHPLGGGASPRTGSCRRPPRAGRRWCSTPRSSIFGAKRLVGREFDSPTVRQVKERSHFEIVAGADRRAAVRLGDDVLSLEEVQGLVLKECREMAEQALGTPVSRAVVTCPAYYSEPQREAVRRAGAMAGLKVERVLNEPTAAALAFGMNRELKKTVLVYDLGGGTFDATLLKLDHNVFEVLATGGDVFLGGVDFDNQLVDLLLERFATWHKRPFSGDRSRSRASPRWPRR